MRKRQRDKEILRKDTSSSASLMLAACPNAEKTTAMTEFSDLSEGMPEVGPPMTRGDGNVCDR